MANPQIEDGYTEIANELLDALCRTKLNSEARRVFDFILRKTYGFHKKYDVISVSQYIEGTGLPKRSVERGKEVLKESNMITTDRIVGSQKLRISIQKDYTKWSRYIPPKETTDRTVGGLPTDLTHTTDKIDGETTDKTAAHKIKKDNIQKKDLDVRDFFSFYLLKTKKQFNLTKERVDLIKKRLSDGFSIDQLKQAVENFVLDDWEGRVKHLDLIYCIGKQKGKPDNLEKWINFRPEKPIRKPL